MTQKYDTRNDHGRLTAEKEQTCVNLYNIGYIGGFSILYKPVNVHLGGFRGEESRGTVFFN